MIDVLDVLKYVKDTDERTRLENLYVAAKRYYSGGKEDKETLRSLQEIEVLWYESLDKGKPDYDLYKNPDMVAETMACFFIYSRIYIKNIAKVLPTKLRTVIDIGCGVGLTTLALKTTFKCQRVVGTNVGGLQTKIAKKLGKDHGFTIRPNAEGEKDVDLVFASEYFEHWEEPIAHLDTILELRPRYLVAANAFGSKSMGHFDKYIVGGRILENKKVGRLFNKHLREEGYEQVDTGFFNNRPTIWKRVPKEKSTKRKGFI